MIGVNEIGVDDQNNLVYNFYFDLSLEYSSLTNYCHYLDLDFDHHIDKLDDDKILFF